MKINRLVEIVQTPLRKTSLDVGSLIAIAALCALLGFALGWGINGWRWAQTCFPMM